jgi:hypothetical protein
MKKVLMSGLIVACFMTPLSATAFDMSKINMFSKKSVKSTVINTPTVYTPITPASVVSTLSQWEKQLVATDTLAQNAMLSVVTMLVPQDEANNIRSQMASILANSVIGDNEKGKQISDLMYRLSNSFIENNSYISNKIAKLSDGQKSSLIRNVALLSKSDEKYTEIANEYTRIATALSKVEGTKAEKNKISVLRQNASALNKRSKAIESFIKILSTTSESNGTGALLFNN